MGNQPPMQTPPPPPPPCPLLFFLNQKIVHPKIVDLIRPSGINQFSRFLQHARRQQLCRKIDPLFRLISSTHATKQTNKQQQQSNNKQICLLLFVVAGLFFFLFPNLGGLLLLL